MPSDRRAYTRQTPNGSIVPFVVFCNPDDPDDVQAVVDPEVVIGVVNGAGGQVDVVTMATRIHLFGIPFADVLAALGILPVPPKAHGRRIHPDAASTCDECTRIIGETVFWSAAELTDPERHSTRLDRVR